MTRKSPATICCLMALLTACGETEKKQPLKTAPLATPAVPETVYFKPDPTNAGVISGSIKYSGPKPARKLIDMSEEPACVDAHHGKAYAEPVVLNKNGTLANVFVYIKSGLEGKTFSVPAASITIDQQGCWFQPRVLGIQVGQRLEVVNSDPVTHNIHPMAVVNREWNHSQGQGDAPLERKFLKPEIIIPVKCNIHSWMHAFIGVVSNPYFAVTGADGAFELKNVPPGDYVIGVWQEKLGTQEMKVTLPPSGKTESNFTFKG